MAITQYIRRMSNKRNAAVVSKMDDYFSFSGESLVSISERINTIQNPELRVVLQAMVDYRDVPVSRDLVEKFVNSHSNVIERRVLRKMLDDSWMNPSLALQFLATTTLDSRITFTRASSATYFDSTGRMATAGNNVARFDYDPVTLLPRGLLIEELRTNFCLWSEDFTNAAWTKTGITPAANSTNAPTGTVVADTLTASGANGTCTQAITTTAVAWTFSVYLKRLTGTGNVDITMDGTTWVTQTINSTSWTRCTVTQTGAAGTSNCGIRLVTSGDAVYAFGAQAE